MKREIISGLIFALGVLATVSAQDLPVCCEGWPVRQYGGVLMYQKEKLCTYESCNEEITIAFSTSMELCLYTEDGDTLEGWPVRPMYHDYIACIFTGPVMGDMNGDNIPEIAVSYGNPSVGTSVFNQVYAYNGESIEQLVKEIQYQQDGDISCQSSTFYDLNNDRMDEWLFMGQDSLYAYDYDGCPVEGFPWFINDSARNFAGGPLVIPGSEGDLIVLWQTEQKIHARRVGEAEELQGWPVSAEMDDYCSPLSGGYFEDNWFVAFADGDSLWALGADGERLRGFPVVVDGFPYTRPNQAYNVALSDYNGDGTPELFVRSIYRNLMGYTLRGEPVSGFPFVTERDGCSESFAYYRIEGDSYGYIVGLLYRGYRYRREMLHVREAVSIDGYPLEFYNNDIDPGCFDGGCTTGLLPVVNDSLRVVICDRSGMLSIYKIPLRTEGRQVSFEWPLPGGNSGGNRFYQPQSGMSAVSEGEMPLSSELGRIYPNPFNGTIIVDLLPNDYESLTFVVYNVLGQKVAEEAVLTTPGQRVKWCWEADADVSSGVYLIRVQELPGFFQKAVLLR